MAFAAMVFVLTSGSAWRHLPPVFAVSPATAHRRFVAWTQAGLWRRLHQRVLDELGAGGQVDWSPAICDSASVQAKKGGGALTGANPVDRGKPGSKIHVLSDRAGLPSPSPSPPPTPTTARPCNRWSGRSRRSGPGTAHAAAGRPSSMRTRATTTTACGAGFANAGSFPIARRGIDSSTRLGGHRWRLEPLLAQLFGYRRLATRYERRADLYCGFLTLAAALTCYKPLTT